MFFDVIFTDLLFQFFNVVISAILGGFLPA